MIAPYSRKRLKRIYRKHGLVWVISLRWSIEDFAEYRII